MHIHSHPYFSYSYSYHRHLHSFPTRRSSDLISNVVETARRFGITSSLPPYLPVALGAAEIRLLEHTSAFTVFPNDRSEEHTSELQSRGHLVCRLLLEKKKLISQLRTIHTSNI